MVMSKPHARSRARARSRVARRVFRVTGLCALAGMVCTCAASSRQPVRTSDTSADEPPHALRVPRQTPLPPARALGFTNDRVLVLYPSDSYDTAVRLVRRFFVAMAQEDYQSVARMLEPGAPHSRSLDGERRLAAEFLRLRFAANDYQVLHEPATLPNQLECFDSETLQAIGPSRGLRETIGRDQTLIRVRVRPDVPASLFARELIFVLHPRGDSLAIAEIVEDYDLH